MLGGTDFLTFMEDYQTDTLVIRVANQETAKMRCAHVK